MSLNSNNNLTPESYQNPGPVPYFPQVFNPGPPPVQQPAVVQVVPPEAFYYLKDSDEHSLRLAVKVEQLGKRTCKGSSAAGIGTDALPSGSGHGYEAGTGDGND